MSKDYVHFGLELDPHTFRLRHNETAEKRTKKTVSPTARIWKYNETHTNGNRKKKEKKWQTLQIPILCWMVFGVQCLEYEAEVTAQIDNESFVIF